MKGMMGTNVLLRPRWFTPHIRNLLIMSAQLPIGGALVRHHGRVMRRSEAISVGWASLGLYLLWMVRVEIRFFTNKQKILQLTPQLTKIWLLKQLVHLTTAV